GGFPVAALVYLGRAAVRGRPACAARRAVLAIGVPVRIPAASVAAWHNRLLSWAQQWRDDRCPWQADVRHGQRHISADAGRAARAVRMRRGFLLLGGRSGRELAGMFALQNQTSLKPIRMTPCLAIL